MSQKLKIAKKDAVGKIKGRLNKLIDRPVSKKLRDALILEGEKERKNKLNKLNKI